MNRFEAMLSNKIIPKYTTELCQIISIGQILELCDRFDIWHTVSAPSPRANV